MTCRYCEDHGVDIRRELHEREAQFWEDGTKDGNQDNASQLGYAQLSTLHELAVTLCCLSSRITDAVLDATERDRGR